MLPDELLSAGANNRAKRLGQYFTGLPLARLLAALAEPHPTASVIDPMCGSGDMLVACSGEMRQLVGIEIDPIAKKRAAHRLQAMPAKRLHLLCGDAFSHYTIESLPIKQFDLVITNPPYVRYQSLAVSGDGDIPLPSAVEIRARLLKCVDLFPHLRSEDRRLFREIIKAYSGFSDLAVPAWILCAMLVAVGGRLALVVPEAWLSRDYARVVQYVLLRWFRVSYVVEDAHAVWFPGTLVKTTLLVADRMERRRSYLGWGAQRYVHAALAAGCIEDETTAGNLFPENNRSNGALPQVLRSALHGNVPDPSVDLKVEVLPLEAMAQNLAATAGRESWLKGLEADLATDFSTVSDPGERPSIPPLVLSWLPRFGERLFITPLDLGFDIGQGLRTGCNQFFYVDLEGVRDGMSLVNTSRIFRLGQILVPSDCLAPVLRKQAELPERPEIDATVLRGRVLVLEKYALPEDIETLRATYGLVMSEQLEPVFVSMHSDLARLVRVASQTSVSSGRVTLIPQLSAVRTNVRNPNRTRGDARPRFWYHLPRFTHRHLPDLLVARVNHDHPQVYLNSGRKAVIDANYSTIWKKANAPVSPHVLLALLSSSWCIAMMELQGTVMGGGALKLEATHLRRLPIPAVGPETLRRLELMGRELTHGNNLHGIQREVDRIVAMEIWPESVDELLARIKHHLSSALQRRRTR